MLWQFGEIGYDFSINFNGRTKEKPLRWNYLQDPNRMRLNKAFSAMIKLKTDNIAFRTANYDLDVWGSGKRMWVTDPSMNVTVIGNFGVDSLNTMMPGFQHTGEWYDYMTGDTIQVNDVNAPLPLAAGQYHIFTDQKLTTPDLSVNTIKIEDQDFPFTSTVYPNPFKDELQITINSSVSDKVQILITDVLGKIVHSESFGSCQVGENLYTISLKDLTSNEGIYFYTIQFGAFREAGSLIRSDK